MIVKKSIAMVMTLFVLVCQIGIGNSYVVVAANSESDFITDSVNGGVRITGYTGASKDVVIPETIDGRAVVEIRVNAFSGKQLTSIELPSSVTTIGDYAFSDNQLTSVELPSSVTTIGNYAFSDNQLTNVELPSSVTEIGEFVFAYNHLTSIELPSSVTTIGSFAFTNNQLTSIELPSSVTTIGSYAFNHNQLTSVALPSSVTTIGASAFAYNQLTSIAIPSSVTTIPASSFANNQLTSVRFQGALTIVGTIFYGQSSPVNGNYIFGWSANENHTTAWSGLVTEPLTIYAQWTKSKVSFVTNTEDSIADQIVDYDSQAVEPAVVLSKEGYTFAGWYKEATFDTAWNFEQSDVKNSLTLYAKWTLNSYTVTYESSGGSTVDSVDVSYGEQLSEPATTRAGYTFGGWYTEDELTNLWSFAADRMPARTITLYAKWTLNSYTVTYESNGGSAVDVASVSYGEHLTEPTTTRAGYTFGG